MVRRGHDPGHTAATGALDWPAYLDALIGAHGSLAAVAERLAATRSYKDDVESITRALRRLRGRASLPGGKWGDRLLAQFGLPRAVDERLRFMGSYHARFVDLPVPLCLDLVQLWDRPPTSESRVGRRWLSLARATLALRTDDDAAAADHLATAAAVIDDDVLGRVEVALGLAHVASRAAPADLAAELAAVPALLAPLTGADADCLRARHAGQVAHALNHAGRVDEALALHAALPDLPTTAPFARSRRANGLAYGHHRAGDAVGALREARRAATFAGDAGHVRLRAMALLMIARIAGPSPEGQDAHARADAIAAALADDVLRRRCRAAARDVGTGSWVSSQ
ncbi:MAG: hypothetical protein IPL61_30170 [Myxococcales bacterium]|nr:hypothetical protein [Myxococcales bacterium]